MKPVPRIAVVGAGVAGLAAAAELAGSCDVTLLDRLPVAGGVLAYDEPFVRELEARCRAAGVHFLLGTTALRLRERRLLCAGPGGIRWIAADRLVYAGGSRPATQAEQRIVGPRLAGVLPATVAVHLAEAGVVLGRRPVLVGAGDWAERAARELAHHADAITVVAPDAGEAPRFRHDALVAGWTPAAVAGDGRVAALVLERDGQRLRVACDAVVLAGSPRPLRNVDGAVRDGAASVTFVQPVAERTTAARVAEEARRLARAALTSEEETA